MYDVFGGTIIVINSSSKEEVIDPKQIEHGAEHEVRVSRVGRVGRGQLALRKQVAAVREPLCLTLRLLLTFTFNFFFFGLCRPLPQGGFGVLLALPSIPGGKL